MRATPGRALPWAGAALAAALSIGSVLWSLPRGLDSTDEGYYLNEIGHPSDSSATALLFGWFWHPVSRVLDGSVVGLRFVGLAVVLAAAGILTLGTLSLIAADRVGGDEGTSRGGNRSWAQFCLVLVVAGLAIVPWSTLPATPSYNTLALLALLVTASGCRYAWVGDRGVVGGALVGLGGFMAVVAKPTTALVLVVAVLALTPWSRRLGGSVVAAVVALLAPSAILIAAFPGHLGGLTAVIVRGVEATVGHPQLIRFDPFMMSRNLVLLVLVAGAFGALAGLWTRRSRGDDPTGGGLLSRALVTLVGLAPVGLAAWSLRRWWQSDTLRNLDLFQPQATLYAFGLVLVLAAVAAVVTAGRRRADRARMLEVRFAVLLVCLPLAFTFGTNTNMWRFAGQVVVFWFLAILVLTGRSGVLATAAGGMAAYTVVVAGFSTPLTPYRSAPLLDTVSAQVSHDGQVLRLPAAQAHRTAAVLEVGHTLGVSRKTTVLDLTGDSPGVIWAWGAQPLAQGWVIGGYPDSARAARIAIAPVACELDRALLLVAAPRARRSLPDDVLAEWDVHVPGDYRVAAEYSMAADPTHPSGATRTVQVLEPVNVHPRGCPG